MKLKTASKCATIEKLKANYTDVILNENTRQLVAAKQHDNFFRQKEEPVA